MTSPRPGEARAAPARPRPASITPATARRTRVPAARRLLAFVFAYAGIIAIPFDIAAVLIGSARYGAYSQVRDALSDLNRYGSPSAEIMKPFEVLYFALLILFAVQLYEGTRLRSMRAVAMLIVTTVTCGILVDFVFRLRFPLDAHQSENGVHTLLALLSALAMVAAIFIAYREFSRRGQRPFALFSLACVVTAVVFTCLTLISLGDTLHAYSGLLERITFGTGLVWLIAFNLVVVRLGWLRMPGFDAAGRREPARPGDA